ncbi:hypothetical protein CDD83_10613 [Cordyceps sp. RAO-2017]|nr:hypothetical protein CDD83_10613 [Cordyceps sp. RAO-2017]
MWATLIEYGHASGDKTYDDLIAQGMLWQSGENQNFMPGNYTASMSNDDQGLWAMAAMLAVEDDSPIRLPPCGSGSDWPGPGYDYKNSFTDGVFFNLDARLARYTGNKTYAAWADRTWNWMEKTGLIDVKTYAVYDDAIVQANKECGSPMKAEFSWPSGIFALGAAHMFNYTDGASTWQKRLDKLVNRGLETFFPNGVATEPACTSKQACHPAMKMWKGVVHQWYAMAAQLAPFTAGKLVPAIEASAKMAARQCTGGDGGRACGFSMAEGSFDGDTGVELPLVFALAVVYYCFGAS